MSIHHGPRSLTDGERERLKDAPTPLPYKSADTPAIPAEPVKRCHKCRSTDLALIEAWDGFSITFEASVLVRKGNEIATTDDGILEVGDPSGVYHWHCFGCDHIWRARGLKFAASEIGGFR